jgi:quinol-cytochrome oxidoreductase complex cytochrome b subunit
MTQHPKAHHTQDDDTHGFYEAPESIPVKIYNFILDFLDTYGDTIDGPGLRHKTIIGALVSTIFRIVVLGIIGYNLYLCMYILCCRQN